MLAISAWCVFCVARTSRERLRLVERMYRDPGWQPYHSEFWQVSPTRHLLYRLLLRDPWQLYPKELRP
jgi:hypothetical protein